MRRLLSVIAVLDLFLGCSPAPKNGATADGVRGSNQVFTLKGVVKELNPDGKTIQIRHEAIPNYMVAMTMPFIERLDVAVDRPDGDLELLGQLPGGQPVASLEQEENIDESAGTH